VIAPATAISYPRSAPFTLGGSGHTEIIRSWLYAASLPAMAGIVLFGRSAAILIAASIGSAVISDFLLDRLTRRRQRSDTLHVVLLALILALTFPAQAPWYIPAFAAFIMVTIKTAFGGISHCLWHPALIGRVLVQFLFSQQLGLTFAGAPVMAPVLAPQHLVNGRLEIARKYEMSEYLGWREAGLETQTAQAFETVRPQQSLRLFADGNIPQDKGLWKNDPPLRFTPLLRDYLPPWGDTILGAVPGAIGETSSLALIVAGLYLIYRGHLRWQLPVAVIAGAALAAALMPISIGANGSYRWVPALVLEDGRAVGLAYVLFHLTAGQLLICSFLLGGEMLLSPLRARGQFLFGAGIGALTIFLRLYGPLDGEGYWAVLAMNSLVPMMDHRLKRPVLGMDE